MAIIAIDFDGTVVKHRYPEVGEDVPGAVECIKELVASGHKIILYTMRGISDGKSATGLLNLKRNEKRSKVILRQSPSAGIYGLVVTQCY